jgi:hypothetical protein
MKRVISLEQFFNWRGPALKRLVTTVVFLALLVVLVTPSVRAQKASITDLNAPIHTLFGKTSTVVVSVNYTTGSKGVFFMAYINDRDTRKYAIGTATSSQSKCLIDPSVSSNSAFCQYTPKSSSGSDSITFNLQLSEKRQYTLVAWVGFQDSNSNAISESLDRLSFGIAVSDKPRLEIDVPFPVVVTVDGVSQTPGTAFLDSSLGQHTISVPSLQPVDPFSRLRFDHWSDGSTQTSRTMNLQDDTTVSILYATQYHLDLASLQVNTNSVGEGWYDLGSRATFSGPLNQPMDGILGMLGGKWVFQGWYEGNSLITSSTSGSIVMDHGHSLTSEWAADYSSVLIILVVVVAFVATMIGLALYHVRNRRT